ncbi:FBP domain-containing protein [Microbacterium sp. GXF7504]
MRPLTEHELKACLVNVDEVEREQVGLPHDWLILDWDHLDFLAWRDPHLRGRGYLVIERDGRPTGIALRAADGTSRARAAVCNVCHTMRPGDHVTLFTARVPAPAEKSIGTYLCSDLTCHENVRIAPPLAPNEIRASVDRRIDGTKHRAEEFLVRVTES